MNKIVLKEKVKLGTFIDSVDTGFADSIIERLYAQGIEITDELEDAIKNTAFINCNYFYEDDCTDELIYEVTIDSEIGEYHDEYYAFYDAVLEELKAVLGKKEIYYASDSGNRIRF